MHWPVTPQGLGDLLRWLSKQPNCPPLYVTENGAAFDDPVIDGAVDDSRRVSYLARHLASVAGAVG